MSTVAGIELRPYQEQAVSDLLEALYSGKNPVCKLATGGGKSLILGELCRALDGRILVVTHRKELIVQNERALHRLDTYDTGVYSAGVGRREEDARVIFAGVQSIYKRMDKIQRAGEFAYVLVDEAHMAGIPTKPSMYNTVFSACPRAQRVGLTATPYRLLDGPIYADSGLWFDSLAVDIPAVELIGQGYLSPVVGVKTASEVDVSKVHKRGGDFILSELSAAASEESVVEMALDEICELAAARLSWLLFCVDVEHTTLIRDRLRDRCIYAEMVTGKTPDEERGDILDRFKRGEIRALCNCEVLTTGFDAPGVDCVVFLRPSESKGLIEQMLGRGLRLSPETGKQDCLLLDMAGNLERHAPLDGVPPARKSRRVLEREEQEEREREAKEREERERKIRHGIRAEREIDPFTGKAKSNGTTDLLVDSMSYQVVNASTNPGKRNLMVSYTCHHPVTMAPYGIRIWICPEYDPSGRAGKEAARWFARRSMPVPQRTDEISRSIYRAPRPVSIKASRDGQWWRVIDEFFDAEQLDFL